MSNWILLLLSKQGSLPLQVLHHCVHSSQPSEIYPVFNQVPEDSWFWRTGPGLGVPWSSWKSPRRQTSVHSALPGGSIFEFTPQSSNFILNIFHSVSHPQELVQAYAAEAAATGKPQLMLTAAVSAGKGTIDAGYEIAEIAKWAC